MQRKICLSLLLIIILIFAFTISSYASTDYSVPYTSSNGSVKYRLSFSFKEKTEFDFSDITVDFSYSSSDIYFILVENTTYNTYPYSVYSSESPFTIGSRLDGSYYLVSSATIRRTMYKIADNTWITDNATSPSQVLIDSTTNVLMSSDTIMDGDTVLFPKYTYSSESNNEGYVVSTYNNEWIESYLDLGMNPSDGIKKVLIDKNQDYFTFTSSELGKYWVCEKVTAEDGSYYYLFLFCPGQIGLRYHYQDFCEYYYVTENLDSSEYKCFSIWFDENGFYSNKSYELTDSCWLYHPELIYNHEFIVSNCDILDLSNGAPEGSVLFTEPETKNGTTLAPVIQREKTKGTLQVVLKEIILILPLILVVVVSLVGLRKALKILFAVLHRS